jgi:hypothetical protein
MIKTLIASTEQIDDLEAAVNEIKTQLDMEHNLLKNSVGIIACHYEFANSGAVKAICDALPFDTAGANSSFQGTGDSGGALVFILMVLTSDDVFFKTALTPSLKEGKPAEAIESAYRSAAVSAECFRSGGTAQKPALIFAYAPFIVENSGDEYVSVLSRVSSGVPCFGTLAVDDTSDFRKCYMLYNGEHYQDRLSMILCYGKLKPQFFLATISRDKILEKSALITSSEGHILKEVNGRPVVEWFESLGLTRASQTSYAMTSLPFMVDYNDGTPQVSKVFIGLNEKREAVCAGAMPEGSTLYLGIFDKDDVIATSREALREALKNAAGARALLIYSCISRSMSLGSDFFAEMNMVRSEIGKFPALMAYSGGEICPTKITGETAINRFHNNTFIVCMF